MLLIVLPVPGPLRLLRILVFARLLGRSVHATSPARTPSTWLGPRSLRSSSGLAVLDAERASPDANIKTFGDALWWAMTTVTTVAYGDRYPVTTQGRLIAAPLMLIGIALPRNAPTQSRSPSGRFRVSLAAALSTRVRRTVEGARAQPPTDDELDAIDPRTLKDDILDETTNQRRLSHHRPRSGRVWAP